MVRGIALKRALVAVAAVAGIAVWQAPAASASVPLKDITHRYVGSAVGAAYLASEPDYRAVLTREFDNVTPENEMKWGVVEPVRGQYDWSGADAIVRYAQQHHKTVRGHTLVWHSQLPDWVAALPADELRRVLRDHITTEVKRYRERSAPGTSSTRSSTKTAPGVTRSSGRSSATASSRTSSAGRTPPTPRPPCTSTTTTSKAATRRATRSTTW